MASSRIGRINEEIMRELSTSIRSLKDPRVQGMITITAVDTASDHRTAKLGASLQLRYTPELVFEEDHSIEHGTRIFEILSKLDLPEDEPNDENNDEQGNG